MWRLITSSFIVIISSLQDFVRYSTDISEKYAGTSSSNATGAEFQAVHGTAQPKVANHDKAAEVSKATAPLSTSSFSFSGLSAPAAAQSISSDGITPAGGEGEEEEGEPIMEAEKVLRNEDDKDEIICDCNCKLFRFDSGKGDAGKGEWIDVGKGVFRVTKCTESGKQRMLVRNSVGKIIFNAAFYKGMKVEQKSKGMLSFGVVTDQSGNLRNFLLKVKDVDVEVVLKSMQSAISVF